MSYDRDILLALRMRNLARQILATERPSHTLRECWGHQLGKLADDIDPKAPEDAEPGQSEARECERTSR